MIRKAISQRPAVWQYHASLGDSLSALRRWGEAEARYRTALSFQPNGAELHNRLGTALRGAGRLAEAEAACRSALQLRSEYPQASTMLGMILRDTGRYAEAERELLQAEAAAPASPEVSYNLATLHLVTGRLETGWSGYEARWAAGLVEPHGIAQPQWRGESVGARTLLLHAEQGLGDTIQFCRYVPLFPEGAALVLEVQKPLMRLMEKLHPGTRVIQTGAQRPPFDLHCPLPSLPLAFGTTLTTIPSTTPYLRASALGHTDWRARLAADPLRGDRPLVGLVWAGNPTLQADAQRSVAPTRLRRLAGITDVRFVSLQVPAPGEPTTGKHSPAADAARASGIAMFDPTAELNDFAETAALVDALDLVIGVDTAVVHLAGAMGRPVWLLNRYDPCWRWLLGRDDSPWYPTLRQFRQPSPGDWDTVLANVAAALAEWAAAHRASAAAHW